MEVIVMVLENRIAREVINKSMNMKEGNCPVGTALFARPRDPIGSEAAYGLDLVQTSGNLEVG